MRQHGAYPACTVLRPVPDPCALRGEGALRTRRTEALSCRQPGCGSRVGELRSAHEPDARTKRYTALPITFPDGVLAYEPDDTLYEAIRHYLTTLGNAKLLDHRLMEILLIRAARNPALLSYALHRELWAERVRAVLSADLARVWNMGEVCKRLATTESTLRRNLGHEGASFRTVLHELRLSTALTQPLQTTHPVYRIAYDCGYRSVSRFTSNFHKRFGVPPKRRAALAATCRWGRYTGVIARITNCWMPTP